MTNLSHRLKNLQPEMMAIDVDENGLPKEEPFIQKDPSSN